MNIPSSKKLDMFKSMLRIRMVEEAIIKYYPEQEMRCPCHLSIGQEAIPVGVCASLDTVDYAFGTYRSHGLYLAKGGNLRAMISELYGKQVGATAGRGGSMQLIAPDAGILCTSAIVAATIPMAVGAALAKKISKVEGISVVFFGDGATEEGIFHESLNFASLKKLPVLFVCENNLYSVYSPFAVRQLVDNIFERARLYNMPSVRADGNNITEVYEVTRKALAHIRLGEGPAFIEFRTYRYREHVGIDYDWHLGYRPESEIQEWLKKCPVATFEQRLLKEELLTESLIRNLREEIDTEVEEAFAWAKQAAFPDPEELFKYVYADSKEGHA